MKRSLSIIAIVILGILFWYVSSLFAAALTIPGGTTIQDVSIKVTGVESGDIEKVGQSFGFQDLL
jgi:hypothetical protein